MTKEEKYQFAIEKGFMYDPITGEITSRFGKIITAKTRYGYIHIRLCNKDKSYQLSAHQFGWYIMNGEIANCIDHINGIKTDNRMCNLRSVTTQENAFNRIKAKGYCWHKNKNKWQAQIKVNGKQIHLGDFDNEDDARQAYLEAKITHHKIN